MSAEQLPFFTYHPDPARTGYVVTSDTVCRSCDRPRGHVYTGSPYAEEDLTGRVCPWCIFDGSAARRFDAAFTDSHELVTAGIAAFIIDEVVHRTPGFTSWQAERWLCHCHDACEFHGDVPRDRLPMLTEAAKSGILADLPVETSWDDLLGSYEPGGQPAIYWFRCRHCGQDLYYADHT